MSKYHRLIFGLDENGDNYDTTTGYGCGQLVADGTQDCSPESYPFFTVDDGNKVTTTRHMATVMFAGCARFDSGWTGESVGSPGCVNARIVVILYVAGKDAVWLGEDGANLGAGWIEFGSANCHG
jgi:hypothetical protein